MKIPKPRKRGDSWRIEKMIDGVKYTCTRDTAEECKQYIADIMLKHKAGIKLKTAKETMQVQDVLTVYYEKAGVKKRGAKYDKELFARFKKNYPKLAQMQVHKADKEAWTEYRNQRLELVKGSTVKRELSSFSAAMTYAVKELFLIERNPIFDVQKPSEPPPRYRRITDDEIAAVMDAAKYKVGTTPKNSYEYVAWAFLFCIETAARRKELLGINRKLHIHDRHIDLVEIKSGRPRIVPTVKSFAKAKELLSLINHNGDMLIPYHVDGFDTAWGKIYKWSGIENLYFKDTRHEAISRWVAEKRAGMVELMKISGHKKPDTFYNVYYNPTADDIIDAV